jgi:hypothetical protein
MNTTATPINQPLAFLMVVPARRNPSVGFAVAIRRLHSRLVNCAAKQGNDNLAPHTAPLSRMTDLEIILIRLLGGIQTGAFRRLVTESAALTLTNNGVV